MRARRSMLGVLSLLLAAVGVGVYCWITTNEQRRPRVVVSASDDNPGVGIDAGVEPPSPREPALQPERVDGLAFGALGLRVRSSTGLLSSSVYVRSSRGAEESRVQAVKSGDAILLNEMPVDGAYLRMPGHSEIAMNASAQELLCLPVLGVEMDAPNLKRRVSRATIGELRLGDVPYEDTATLCGFANSGRFAIAVDGDRYLSLMTEPLEFSLCTIDGVLVRGVLNASANGEFQVDLPLPPAEFCSVALNVLCEANCSVPKLLKWWPRVSEESVPARELTFPWGSLSIDDGVDPVEEQSSRAAIDDLVAGREYGVGVVCPVHERYGREFFVAHDGARVDLVTYPRILIEGHVTPADVGAVDVSARFYVTYPRKNEAISSWFEEHFIELQDGRFRLSLPGSIAIASSAPVPLPSHVLVRVSAPTCDRTERVFEVQESIVGEFELECRADLFLSVTEATSSYEAFAAVMFLDERGDQQYREVAGALRSGDGVKVSLSGDGLNGKLPNSIVVLTFGDEDYLPVGYELAENEYRPVASDMRIVEVHADGMSSDAESLWVGWQWRGIRAPFKRILREDVGERLALPRPTPVGVEAFWWSTGTVWDAASAEDGPAPEVGGTVPPTDPILVRIP